MYPIVGVRGRSCALSCSWQSLEGRKEHGKGNPSLPSSPGHQNLRACASPAPCKPALPSLPTRNTPAAQGYKKGIQNNPTTLRFDAAERSGCSFERSRIMTVSTSKDPGLLLPKADSPIFTRSIAHLKQSLPDSIQPTKTLFC